MDLKGNPLIVLSLWRQSPSRVPNSIEFNLFNTKELLQCIEKWPLRIAGLCFRSGRGCSIAAGPLSPEVMTFHGKAET